MAENEDLSFTITGTITANKEDDVVFSVQRYLRHFGYLRAGFVAGRLDQQTEQALINFQRRRQIAVTGEIDFATVFELQSPRCGVQDFPRLMLDTDPACISFGSDCILRDENISYYFENFYTAALSQQQVETEVAAALQKWRYVIRQVRPINFSHTHDPSSLFIFGFFEGYHLAGLNDCCIEFDRVLGRLGHAFSPKPCCGERAGYCHFDAVEDWRLVTGDGINFRTIALHEIGHLLGLSHSSLKGSLMFEDYKSMADHLTQDDIDRILTLYS